MKGPEAKNSDMRLVEQSMEELFLHAPCGYILTDAAGLIIKVNETFLLMTGFSRESLVGQRTFQSLLSIGGRIYHDTHFAPLLMMQGGVQEVAFDIGRADGRPIPVLVNAAAARDSETNSGVIRMTVSGAADRRTYEAEILLARKQAEAATESERIAREEAERANRLKDEFLALVSHELRNPLNSILGWSQILRRQVGSDVQMLRGLSVIERSANTQAELINDLLDMGRILSGKMRLDVQQLDIAAVLDAACEICHPAADAKGIKILSVFGSSIFVLGDFGRLQQVFWNLLSNAIKFTPRGGTVIVSVERVNSHLEIKVEDNGAGMTADVLAGAFERFRQGTSQNSQRTDGLGLGLSIVKSLVEMHGGIIRAASPGEGKGSTFVVELPLAASKAEVERHDFASHSANTENWINDLAAISLHGLKVLVVDDVAAGREIVCHILAERGAELRPCESAEEALTTIPKFQPHVVISDIGMPGKDGYELVRQLRMLGSGINGTPAIALTAMSRLEDRTRALLAGFQAYLPKPVDPRELIAAVASLSGRTKRG